MSVFGRMQLRFLEAGGVRLRTGAMLATVYSANALSVSVPLAGPGLGGPSVRHAQSRLYLM